MHKNLAKVEPGTPSYKPKVAQKVAQKFWVAACKSKSHNKI
jgi:hypothetical protein